MTRRLVVSCVVYVAIGTTLASAQTVIVRHAAPGSTIELVLDAAPVATATADSEGTATLVATDKIDVPLDASVWVDTCADVRRIILARRGAPLLAAAACRRAQIAAIGLYVVQRITTIVVDVRSTPSLLISQGRAPDEWLREPRPVVEKAPAAPLPPLTGLTLFGGMGRSTSLNFKSQSCGNVTCSNSAPIPYSAGVVWWFNDYVGAEGRYTYLGNETAKGSDDAFSFTTTREGGVIALTGRAGVRVGRFRPFGRAGLGLHRATLTTTQTTTDRTIVVDDVEQTVPGGTQTLQMRTKGWAPVYGGGVEIWLTPSIGIYGEGQRIGLKGTDDRGSGITTDDAAITVQVGLTIRLP